VTETDARYALDHKTKPPGSLGRLEWLAVRLAVLQQTLQPDVERARISIFAADHGVAEEGVSAYPSRVTAQMTRTFVRGGAAICVLAAAGGIDVEVIDVGVDAAPDTLPGIVPAKVRCGSRNFLHEPAMTPEELEAALEAGRAAARRAAYAGARALGLGEMGIGNTTAAAAVLSALTGASAELTVGRGTGIDDRGLVRKREVVERGLIRHAAAMRGGGTDHPDPRQTLACLGGLDLAAIAGAALEAPKHGLAVVADGFISTVAILAAASIATADRLHPLGPALFIAHRSAELGHGLALEALANAAASHGEPLDTRPLLELNLRLGEGTGAALAIPILRAAARVLRDMATFEEAGVSDGDGA
jgi:nicotinate-nucleotide--dimethylbenzimidazole phosphoribosyltransferase